MKKNRVKRNKILKYTDKKTLSVYIILRVFVILCLIRELMLGEYQNALLCILSLVLFLLPAFIEKTFKVELPSILEINILIFIFASEILGEINNFYGTYNNFDTILHTITGFLSASVGFSLIYLLNNNIESFNLSGVFVAIVAFCFSMTIGILWEFFEFGMDNYFNLDMQKDTYIKKINTVTLDESKSNKIVSIDNIDKVILYDKNDKEIAKLDGYLDIGIIDTMQDLKVNFIGAFIYSIFGYLYIVNKDKNKLAKIFLITKRKQELK